MLNYNLKLLKEIITIITIFVAFNLVLAEEPKEDWFTFYYTNPTPDSFSKEVRYMADKGMLKNESAIAPIIAFLSQVMSANPQRIEGWINDMKNLDEEQQGVLLSAAWYSNTQEARDFFKKQNKEAYLKQIAPDILKLEVNSPTTLDMLWGHFMASGDIAPIKRIVSALSLSKYAGSLDRFKTSEKTEKDKEEAYLDLTFQAAQWSLESNCKMHPRVLEYCEKILIDKTTSKNQSLWLGIILSKVKPEAYSIEIKEPSKENKNE